MENSSAGRGGWNHFSAHHHPPRLLRRCSTTASSNSSTATFDTIPEVPARGAVVKVVYAGAHVKNGNPSSDYATNSSFIRPSLLKRENSGEGADPPKANGHSSDPLTSLGLFPSWEVSGYIEDLGEDVADLEDDPDCGDLRVGDPVIVCPFRDQNKDYASTVSVPELSSLVRVPDSIPLQAAPLVVTGARNVKNAVARCRGRNNTTNNNGGVKRLLVIGTNENLVWALSLLDEEADGDEVVVTVASGDEALLAWIGKTRPRFRTVQWNDDGYDVVLVERVLEAAGDLMDLVLNLGATKKPLHRSLSCLKKGGRVIMARAPLPTYIASLARTNGQEIEMVDQGDRDDVRDLVTDIAHNIVRMPTYLEFSCLEHAAILKCLRGLRKTAGCVVVKMTQGGGRPGSPGSIEE